MKEFFIMFCLLLLGSSALWGQSNEVIDQFLEIEQADVGTTMLLLGQSLGELPDSADTAAAENWAEAQSWYKYIKSIDGEDFFPLGRYFAVLYNCYGIESRSMMFSLFKTPRYAAMDAYDQEYFFGSLFHTRPVTSQEVLYSITKAMEVSGE
ncbi:MAG: hypothetical protein B6241_04755 [Spirochaetaceae bacterium 4572_59]|nr:MAG: hypothetical protein B6241_04755 [Spirochaetaceae bacterium 4572_59]